MNQLEIESQLDKKLGETEELLQKRLRTMQRNVLKQLSAMYAKYEQDGALTTREMQKYNRLEKELQRITQALTDEYKQVVSDVQAMQQEQYRYST